MWKILKKITTLEIITIIVFAIYLIFDIQLPMVLNKLIDTSLGVVVILILTLLVFISSNPIVGVIAIIVAYELVRRSSNAIVGQPRDAIFQYPTIQIKPDQNTGIIPAIMKPASVSASADEPAGKVAQTVQFNNTLEEEVVKQMAPLSTGLPKFIETEFKPVSEHTHNASII